MKKTLSLGLGERIKRARLDLTGELGGVLSPETLGGVLGVSGQTVRNWEAGATEPGLAMIERVADELRTSPEYLCFGVGEKSVPYIEIRPAKPGKKIEVLGQDANTRKGNHGKGRAG